MHWRLNSSYGTFPPSFPAELVAEVLMVNRMWNESGAAHGDFPRVSALVRSQYVPLPLSSLIHKIHN